MSNAVSTTGRRMLADNEAIIENGLAGFLAIGKALEVIRSQRLYRDDYGDFETYLKGRWGMSKSRGYQLLEALALSTIVDELGCLPLANEGQLRALLPVKGDRKALVEIVEKAHADGDTSARNLSKYVAAYTPPTKKIAEKRTPTSGSSESDSGAPSPVAERPDAAGRDDDVQVPPPVPSPAPNAAPPPSATDVAIDSAPTINPTGPATVIETTAREHHVHRCDCGVEWDDNAKQAVAS